MNKFKVVGIPTYINLSDDELSFVKSLGFTVTPIFNSFDEPNGFKVTGEGFIELQSIDQLQELIKNQKSIIFEYSRGRNLVCFRYLKN